MIAFKIYAVIKIVCNFNFVVMNICRKHSMRGVSWNQLKSEDIETLHLLSVLKHDWKNQCRSFISEHTLILSWLSRYHIESSPLICRANQWNGFYMITVSVIKELKWNKHEHLHFADFCVKNIFNSFHSTGIFLHSLKNISKRKVCWCFQGHRKRPLLWNGWRVV